MATGHTGISQTSLLGKTILITGANRGIGASFAMACSQAGADVAAFSRSSLQEVSRQIKQETGREILSIQGDMLRLEDIRRMIESTVQKFGKLDVLVNNAAAMHIGRIIETTEEDWDLVVDTNLKGVYFSCKYAALHMIGRRSGVIINLGSELSFVGAEGYSAYCASKGGVLTLSKALAVELGPHNIRVVALCPGPTNTDMCKDIMSNADSREQLLKRGVLNRINEPEDVAAVLVMLASDAARMVTGCAWPVDGGTLAK